MMTEYDKLLIELLRDKIRQWENKCNDQRIEINRLKKELREAKKEVQAKFSLLLWMLTEQKMALI